MATPKVLIKRSSVAGRIPTTGDLDYGELAINFQDGKIYYKDASNNIKAFVDSARVQAIADAVEVTAQAQLDSAEVTSLIDAAYIQARQNNFLDSALAIQLIDSAYVQLRQTLVGEAGVDSAGVVTIINTTVNQSFVRNLETPNPTFGNDFVDSNAVEAIITQPYVRNFETPNPTLGNDFVDSGQVELIVDSSYVQNRQIKYTTADFVDSAGVSDIILGDVTTSYVRDRQIKYTTADFPDSAGVQLIVDTNYIRGKADSNYIKTAIDSAYVVGIADSAYIKTVQYGDDEKLTFGANPDLEIYHNSTQNKNYVLAYGGGNITIGGQNVILGGLAGTTTNLKSTSGAGIELYHGGTKRLETSTSGVGVTGKITGLTDPTASQDAATKSYVDAKVASGTDSATVSAIILADVDSAYVRARAADQELSTTDSVSFAGLTVSGNLTVTGTTTEVNTVVYTINDPLLHLADSNEQSDVVDIGHIGHYYRNGQRRHTGIFRDASNEEYYIFNNMVDSAFDSVLPPNVINRSATDFELSILNVGTLRGIYAGFDSDFTQKSTTNLSEGSNLYYTKTRVDSDISAAFDDSSNTVNVTINNFVTDTVDSAYVLARVNDAPFLDSTYTTALIDTNYVQARQVKYNTSNFTDSAFVTGLPVSTFTNDANYLDSTTVQGVIDQTYVTGLIDTTYLDSAETIALIDSAHVQLHALDGDKSLNGLKALQFIHDSDAATYTVTVASKDASHRYQGTGSGSGYKIDGTFAPTIVMNPGNTYRFDLSDATNGSHPLYFYYDAAKTTQYTTNVVNNYSSNSAGSAGSYIEITITDATPPVLHYQCGNHGYMGNMIFTQTRNLTGFDTDDLTEGSTNLYHTTTRVNTAIDNRVDQTFVDNLAVNYSSLTGTPTIPTLGGDFVDSAQVEAIIDSAYVQLRQSGGEITIQEEGTPLSTAATTLNFVGSAVTASGTGTTKTITISQAEGGTDSATVVSIINTTVDSAYVQLREAAGGGAGGLDSALVTQLVDSAYVTARQSGTVNITDAITQTVFYYTADSGQTTFTGADDDGGTLAYTTNKIAVYINGLYQQETADYTATNGTSVVLTEAADSGDIIAIETLKGSNLTSQPIFRKVYHYTATNGQTAFTGADDFSDTLTYKAGRVQAYLNGIMLIGTTDFTATDGSTVNLTVGADSGDIVSIEKLDGTGMGIDSAVANTLIDARVTQSFVNNLNVDAETLGGRDSSYLLNYNNFTNTPTIPTLGNDFVDSDEVVTLITANAIDSAAVIALIDSAYVQAREGAGGGGTVDSATTIAIVEDELAVFSVGDLVGADGNPGDALISDGDGTASWNGNVALSYEFKVNYDSLGVISSVSDLPTGFTADSTGSTSIIISHNTGRSVKDISYNSYVSGTLKLRHPSRDSADVVTYAVADRLNKFTATVGIANTGADADQYAWVNITF